MKLNKPKTTENQTELESYIANLLVEEPDSLSETPQPVIDKPSLKSVNSNVLDINQSKKNNHDLTHKLEKTKLVEKKAVKPKNNITASMNALEGEVEKCHKESVEVEHSKVLTKEADNFTKANYKDEIPDPRLQGVEKLLAKISLASMITVKPEQENNITKVETQEVELKEKTIEISNLEKDIVLDSASSSFSHREHLPLKNSLGNIFQTLVFEVNKLPLAVPLIKLGGIVNITPDDITPLVGTPSWFMGLVPNERGNLMVVDTQQFLMPEKKMVETKEYQYLIILDNSQWALACHSVGDAKNLSPDDVRWSARSSKRPWFAGMVVEYMSALIEVDELINMLANNITD